MMNREQMMIELEESLALLADGFEEALVGVDEDKGRAVYDVSKMIDIMLSENEGMTYDEALEYLEFNTFRAYVGEMTPIYVNFVHS